MTTRQRILAALRYQPYDRLPVLHFGFLERTIRRWQAEGHLTADEADGALHGDASPGEDVVGAKLGFDANYHRIFAPNTRIWPHFEAKVLEEMPDGKRKVLNAYGAILLNSDDNQSIPAEVGHTLTDRASWDTEFRWRLDYRPERVTGCHVNCAGTWRPFEQGGREYLADPERETHILLHAGSLIGALRDYVGVENLAYLTADDPALLDEMIEVNAELCYRCVDGALAAGGVFDIGHFWEDICYKNGPLVNPRLMAAKVAPHYRRITQRMAAAGLDLVSLDSDGLIDLLVPIWLESGVNVMFPIEVGTWGASLGPWREQYGAAIRGVGGTDKRVFQRDQAAVDAEIERLRPLVDQGGYIPCPDHRLPHDNRWETVQYYCDRMRAVFGG